MSWRLAASGLDVICLEQGDFVKPEDFPSRRVDWELAKYSSFSPFPNVRRGDFDYPIDDSESPIAISNFNAVGGSTVLFSGHFPRFHPSDFATQSLDGVGSDWPITYEDLEPYFAINDEMMGVAGLEGDPAYPTISNLLPPVPLGKLGEKLALGCNKLGWHWWPSYSAIMTKPRGRRAACINLGPCNAGCSQGAKSSVDVSYWPDALSLGVRLMTRSQALKLVEGNEGEVRSVEVVSDSRKRQLKAKAYVLACNGVGTPRLLLNSESRKVSGGLANSSGLVGKNLMLHPLGYIEGLFEEDLESHFGPQGCCFSSHEFYETRDSHSFKRGYSFQVLRGAGPVETAVSGYARRQINWGRSHHDDFARRYGRVASIAAITEDLAEATNRVTLNRAVLDSNGMPTPKIQYTLSSNTRKMMSHALQKGRELLTASGAIKTSAFGPVRETGWHLMGTTRMGVDPMESVVDSGGKSHDVPNLYIADSSVFVSAGAVNPTSTLQAVSLWIADSITRDLGRLTVRR